MGLRNSVLMLSPRGITDQDSIAQQIEGCTVLVLYVRDIQSERVEIRGLLVQPFVFSTAWQCKTETIMAVE